MKKPDTKKRLSRDDWLRAGLAALAQRGPSGLGIESLARGLGATKGSFYWHFKDLGAFHAALLCNWEEHTLSEIGKQAERAVPHAARLRQILEHLAVPDHTEIAIRIWAGIADAPAEALARVDANRLALVAQLLSDCGVTNPDLARALHAAAIGMKHLAPRESDGNDTAIGTLLDLVLALR